LLWFVQDFALLAVILRAITLSLQTLLLGGILFTLLILPAGPANQPAWLRCRCWIGRFGLAMTVPLLLSTAIDSALLMGTTELHLRDLLMADYVLWGAAAILAALAIYVIVRADIRSDIRADARAGTASRRRLHWLWAPAAVLLLAAVSSSHAVSRLDHRVPLSLLTGLHQAGAAAWVGGLAFLLIALAATKDDTAAGILLRRFVWIAATGAATIITTGIWLSLYYVGSWPALYGTAYGVMLIVKATLLCSLLLLGGLNWALARQRGDWAHKLGTSALLLVRRLAEVETAIGFTIILAASSLTSQPPAIDLVDGRLTGLEIIQRFTPIAPRFTSPPVGELAPATPLDIAVPDYDNAERAAAHQDRDPDIAWSEYSHHWAGIILLIIGIGALLSSFPRLRWARHWPLGFVALAIFAFLRGDPENWPLGPISFWKSFYDPEVLTHRIYYVIFLFYAGFEWGVQTGRLTSLWTARVFPVMLALGGAGLLLHNHAMGNEKNELLIEISHNAMGILAVFAGLGRWLEIQLPESRARRVTAHSWPVFLILIGCLLMNYREA
jgi:putative copper resistance protein D